MQVFKKNTVEVYEFVGFTTIDLGSAMYEVAILSKNDKLVGMKKAEFEDLYECVPEVGEYFQCKDNHSIRVLITATPLVSVKVVNMKKGVMYEKNEVAIVTTLDEFFETYKREVR